MCNKSLVILIPIIEAMYFIIVYQQNIQSENELSHTSSPVAVVHFSSLDLDMAYVLVEPLSERKQYVYIEYYLIRNSDSLHTFTYQFYYGWKT